MKTLGWIFRISLLVPVLFFAFWLVTGEMGADPAKTLNQRMGQFGLYYLALNLAVGALIASPVRFPKSLRFLAANRRWLGVVTFLYLVLHVLLYLTMEGFETQGFTQIVTKTYLILGFGAFLVMAALAATSNDLSVRKLGFRRWKLLHRMVYLATAAVTAHVMLIEKADLIFYGIFFAVLWLIQVPRLLRLRTRA